MNWKIRLRNPVFWTTVTAAGATLVYSILALFDVVPRMTESAFMNAVTVVVSALTTLGVLVDPTTKGIKDSARAMTYTSTADSDLDWIEEGRSNDE